MNTREGIATILSQAVNIATNFETSVANNMNFHALFSSNAGQVFADECDKLFTSHNFNMDNVVKALHKATEHIAETKPEVIIDPLAEPPLPVHEAEPVPEPPPNEDWHNEAQTQE